MRYSACRTCTAVSACAAEQTERVHSESVVHILNTVRHGAQGAVGRMYVHVPGPRQRRVRRQRPLVSVFGSGRGHGVRSLLRFDMASIPTNAVVQQATLKLYWTANTVAAHRVWMEWVDS